METTLILSPTEIETFKRFQKYHDLFVTMENVGVFDIGFGKATLNYAGGILQNIVKEEIVYKR